MWISLRSMIAWSLSMAWALSVSVRFNAPLSGRSRLPTPLTSLTAAVCTVALLRSTSSCAAATLAGPRTVTLAVSPGA